MANVAIRCNASLSMGMGHVIRQRNLGKILRERGMEISYFICDFQPAIKILKKENFSIHTVAPDAGLPRESRKFDLAILDIRDTNRDLIESLRPRSKQIASFEDLGEGRNHVDVLIDCNLEPEQSREIPARIRTLFGLDHSVIHPDFARVHQQQRQFPETWNHGLITLGGSDPNQWTLRLAQTVLKKKKHHLITALIGPAFENTGPLEKLAVQSNSFILLRDVSSMAKALAAHDIVFCAGGVTLHEALAAGTPAFVVSQIPHQEAKARALETKGAAVNLGLAENFEEKKLEGVFDLGVEKLEAMSRAGKNLIDGKGVHRVAEELIQQCLSTG